MKSETRTRQNWGKHRLLCCVPCEQCRQTIYPAEEASYRVRTAYTGLNSAPAFYYSHVVCPVIGVAVRVSRW